MDLHTYLCWAQIKRLTPTFKLDSGIKMSTHASEHADKYNNYIESAQALALLLWRLRATLTSGGRTDKRATANPYPPSKTGL